jgi:hypothetical protein
MMSLQQFRQLGDVGGCDHRVYLARTAISTVLGLAKQLRQFSNIGRDLAGALNVLAATLGSQSPEPPSPQPQKALTLP